jgi:hypothetical protein
MLFVRTLTGILPNTKTGINSGELSSRAQTGRRACYPRSYSAVTVTGGLSVLVQPGGNR